MQVVRSVHSSAPSITRGKGVVDQLPAVRSGHLLDTALLTFQPGGGYERDKIGHSGEEMVYVMAGTVQLHFGDQISSFRKETWPCSGPRRRTRSATAPTSGRRC